MALTATEIEQLAADILDRHGEDLHALPGVTGIAIEECDGQLVVEIRVVNQRALTQLIQQRLLPEKVEGLRVRVQLCGPAVYTDAKGAGPDDRR